MPKTYFNSLITGNSEMLACMDDKGELVRLFWPHIDYPQHIDRFMVGILCPELWQGTSWLCSDEWVTEQSYITDTNVAVTIYTSRNHGIRVSQTDFVHAGKPVFSRYCEVENKSDVKINAGFVIYSSSISTTTNSAGILFDAELSALIHYRHDYYYSISAGTEPQQYQLGAEAYENAGRGQLAGNDTIGMMNDGALLWETVAVEAGDKMRAVWNICMADRMRTVKALTREMQQHDPDEAVEHAIEYWRSYLADAGQIETGNPEVDELYRRSLLVFALMTNKRTGALLAAPEIDEEFTKCGRYAYCWGRDAAFIAAALDKCGLSEDVEHFYRWTAEIQDEAGSWQQRYYMDGNLAPSWGYQADEGGSIIWGILQHYETGGNKEFLRVMWPCVKKGVEYLINYTDDETGLPWLSFDLWEERLGEHAYSTAAVCAGIEAGVRIAEILEIDEKAEDQQLLLESWRLAAAKMREALERNFWKPEWNRFVRSVRVKLNGWGEEHTDAKVWLKRNDRGITRDYSLLDGAVDISLLGLSVPFGIYSVNDPRMISTAEVVEQVLTVKQAGGLMRYEYDGYIGGNPWIIATCWAALYHIERKSYDKAREYLHWVVKSATGQGLLPEQADKESGKPAWVIPLTWSHAMFVLVLHGLIEAGESVT